MGLRSRVAALTARLRYLERLAAYQPSRPVVVILDATRSPAEHEQQVEQARQAYPGRAVHAIRLSVKPPCLIEPKGGEEAIP